MRATHYGLPHTSDSDKLAAVRSGAARLFYQRNMRWTSQRILAAVTELPTLGGSAWVALKHDDPAVRHAFAVWANSTLGMAVHWARAQRQQAGRSRAQIAGVKSMPCPDFTHPDMHDRAKQMNNTDTTALLTRELLPANKAYEDPARLEIDTATARLLDFPLDPGSGASTALAALAQQWCAEPSVAR